MDSRRLLPVAFLAAACAGASATDSGSNATAAAGGSASGGKAGSAGATGGTAGASVGGSTSKGGAAGMAGTTTAGGGAGAPPGGTCGQCAATTECATGDVCAQLPQASDAFCLPACPAGGCATGAVCMPVATTEGDQTDVCVPVTECGGGAAGSGGATSGTGGSGVGAGPGAGGTSSAGAGGSTGTQMCGSLIAPDAKGLCTSCTTSGKTCQANGCYGGWWCNVNTMKCQAPPNPATCGGGTGGTGAGTGGSGTAGTSTGTGGSSAGGGTVGPDGGTVSVLRFAVVGDTRPPIDNDTKGYPTAVISQIWADIEAHSLRPDFAVSTGDYMFASPSSGQAAPQLDLYLKARSAFSGVQFPAFGNHECTGATTSNCGPQGKDGITDNYTQFLSKMLAPIGKKAPYYAVSVDGASGWTAKFVFVAANAWDTAQATWLDQTLSQATTYTFVVRHESDGVTGVTGVTESKAIIDAHPFTLKIVGHAHTYQRSKSARELIVGNGGAPLAGSVNYGYVIGEQRSDGAIVFTAYDYATNAQIDQFAIDAAGNPA